MVRISARTSCIDCLVATRPVIVALVEQAVGNRSEGSTSAIVHVSTTERGRGGDADAVDARTTSSSASMPRCCTTPASRRPHFRQSGSGGPRPGRSPTSRRPTRWLRRHARARRSGARSAARREPGRGGGPRARESQSSPDDVGATAHAVPFPGADQLGDRLVGVPVARARAAATTTRRGRARSRSRHATGMPWAAGRRNRGRRAACG